MFPAYLLLCLLSCLSSRFAYKHHNHHLMSRGASSGEDRARARADGIRSQRLVWLQDAERAVQDQAEAVERARKEVRRAQRALLEEDDEEEHDEEEHDEEEHDVEENDEEEHDELRHAEEQLSGAQKQLCRAQQALMDAYAAWQKADMDCKRYD